MLMEPPDGHNPENHNLTCLEKQIAFSGKAVFSQIKLYVESACILQVLNSEENRNASPAPSKIIGLDAGADALRKVLPANPQDCNSLISALKSATEKLNKVWTRPAEFPAKLLAEEDTDQPKIKHAKPPTKENPDQQSPAIGSEPDGDAPEKVKAKPAGLLQEDGKEEDLAELNPTNSLVDENAGQQVPSGSVQNKNKENPVILNLGEQPPVEKAQVGRILQLPVDRAKRWATAGAAAALGT